MRPATAHRAFSIPVGRGCFSLAAVLLVACASRQPPPSPPLAEKSAPATIPDAGKVEVRAEPLSSDEGVILEGEACLSCHSAELIQTTRIGLAGWIAEVTKMRGWGALVDESKVASVAGWFAQRYPAAEAAPAPATTSPTEAISVVAMEPEKRSLHGDRQAGAALYAKDCASCHGANAEGTGGGPVLIEAPAIYQRTRFTELVLKGKGRMPAAQGIGDAEISHLIAFLRALH